MNLFSRDVQNIKSPKFYGRRQGRKIRPQATFLIHQRSSQLILSLDQDFPNSLKDLFKDPVKEIWMEIGFGSGEHLIHQLIHHPEIGMIGCEPFQNGVAQLIKSLPEEVMGRVRIFPDDVRLLWPYLPSESIHRLFMLFPDPWPKKRHYKRRLLNLHNLDLCIRLLKTPQPLNKISSGLFYGASDDVDYVSHMLGILKNHVLLKQVEGVSQPDPKTWSKWPSHWPVTRYGKKAIDQGKPCAFFVFAKKN